jgi:holliday junction DNA helicase RuvA
MFRLCTGDDCAGFLPVDFASRVPAWCIKGINIFARPSDLGAGGMIAHLKGRIEATGIDHVVIDVNGVGYLAGASARTIAALGAIGDFATLHTEMLVSEDSIRLMGFATASERDWFRLLTSVQGVGAKVALAILSILSPEEVQTAVARADAAMIARANGVGPKLAQRIVNELKDKAGGVALGAGGAPGVAAAGGAAQDAVSAMLNLGFKPAEASAAVNAAADELGTGATLDALVRLALRKAAK